MKLFAALGPGDIVAAHRTQMAGGDIVSETSVTYSGQLLEYCRLRGIEVLAISHNPREDSLRDGGLQIENRPRIGEKSGGLRYHVSRVAYAFYLIMRARRFGADLAMINRGTAHDFAFTLFRLFGIPVVMNYHGTIWPNGIEPTTFVERLLLAFDAWFLRWIVAATAGVSPECANQVRQLAGPALPFFEYRAQFRREGFQSRQRNHAQRPFRILFVGRAERNKGVLDIAAMADALRRRTNVPIVFEVCGDGSALAELRKIVTAKQLENVVRIHGQLARPELLEVYARGHAVVVPTHNDFCEGLPKACAEAVLSGLPIITSRLSNALPVLGPAVVEAEPEIIESYVEAILSLAQDRALYKRLSTACPSLARQFLDRSQSYSAAMDRLIAHVFPTWKPLSDYEPLFARVY